MVPTSEVATLVVESSNSYVYVACCAYLASLNPYPPSSVFALRPREPDFRLFCVACGESSVQYRDAIIDYSVTTSDAVASDPKPEPYRQLVLKTRCDKSVLLEFVQGAVEQHRWRMTAPRGQPGSGVMRFVWDEDAQCWDNGKLVAHRPLDTLYLSSGVATDVLGDLQTYLKRETLELYASLHISPVRVYMLHGIPGGGKTTLLHCLASETGNNLAVINFHPHTSDNDLATAIRNLPPRCFLCIEDIDCLFETRTTRNHGVSFASLLAALDGAYDNLNGSALTVFMTTNAMEQLDQALRRRVDYAVEFTYATKQQCKRMFSAFHPNHGGFETLWAAISHFKFSTSVFQKFLIRTLHMTDPLLSPDLFGSLVECTYGHTPAQHMYG